MICELKTVILEEKFPYTGSELRPHFALTKTKQYGSVILGWFGPCDVKTSELVDQEDRLANDHIKAKEMLHLIGEIFGISLETGVLYQRLLIDHARDLLVETGVKNVTRRGDDLFVGDCKMSVSIATASGVSVLIHWGLNVDSTGAPVRAIGLADVGISKEEDLRKFAQKLTKRFTEEVMDIQLACCKVSPV